MTADLLGRLRAELAYADQVAMRPSGNAAFITPGTRAVLREAAAAIDALAADRDESHQWIIKLDARLAAAERLLGEADDVLERFFGDRFLHKSDELTDEEAMSAIREDVADLWALWRKILGTKKAYSAESYVVMPLGDIVATLDVSHRSDSSDPNRLADETPDLNTVCACCNGQGGHLYDRKGDDERWIVCSCKATDLNSGEQK